MRVAVWRSGKVMIPGDGAGGTPAPRPGDGRTTHTSPGIEPTAQTKGSELLCQVSLSITRFRTLPFFLCNRLPLILDASNAFLWRGATYLANVAPSGRNSWLLLYPGLRRPPGASPGVMHGAALRAELGRSDDVLCPLRAECHHHSMAIFLRRRRLTMLNPRL